MTWDKIDPKYQELANQTLTPAEREAWALSLNPPNGYRTIGRILNISPSAARDRIQRARYKLAQAQLAEENTT